MPIETTVPTYRPVRENKEQEYKTRTARVLCSGQIQLLPTKSIVFRSIFQAVKRQ